MAIHRERAERLLEEASEILRKWDRCGAEVFFGIGGWMRKWKQVMRYKTITAAGIDACKRLRPRGHSYDPGYYYAAYAALEKMTEAERNICVKYAVPVSGIRALVHMERDLRMTWLGDIQSGRVLPPYRIARATARERTPPARERAAAGGTDAVICEFRVRGDESQDEMQDRLESLLSAIIRLRYPVRLMADEALRRVAALG